MDDELLGFGEVLKQTDAILHPAWRDLVLIVAVKIIAEQYDLTLKEQLHVWRPFDV